MKKRFGRVENRLRALRDMTPRPPDPSLLMKDRAARRRSAFKFGMVFTPDLQEHRCVVKDISQHGAKISMNGVDGLPEEFRLAIDGYSAPVKVQMIWSDGVEAGVRFIEADDG